MIGAMRKGIDSMTAGLELARSPKLRPYLVIPVVANILLFSVSGYLILNALWHWLADWSGQVDLWSWLDWAEAGLNSTLQALKWLVFAVVVLLLLFIAGSTFTMLTHTLIGPFLGILGERAEAELRPLQYPKHSLGQIVVRSLKRELQKLWYWLIRAFGLLIISIPLYFMPGINVLVTAIWFLFGAWVLALQYLDIPADNNGRSFNDLLTMMRRQRVAVLGFGSVIMLFTSLPIVNLFIVPVATCAGVIFWIRHLDH